MTEELALMKVAEKWPMEAEAPQISAEVEVLDVVNVLPPQANDGLINSDKDSWSPQIERGAERKAGRGARRPRKWV